MTILKCLRCKHQWVSRVEKPKCCPNCKSYKWASLLALLLITTLLTACEHKHDLPLISPTHSTIQPHLTVLVMGQSNAVFFVGGGYSGFKTVYPDTTFINCAAGGTPIALWVYGGPLYQACKDMVGQTPISAIIWIQGENEAQGKTCPNPNDCLGPVESYSQNLTDLQRHLLADFKAITYFARLNDINAGPYWNLMRQQQEQTTLGIMVSLDGIPTIPGDIHYTQGQYSQIGQRFAEAITPKP